MQEYIEYKTIRF